MISSDMLAQYSEVVELVHTRRFEYPIETKAQFIVQMSVSREPIIFRGVPYDPVFGASLVPEFFFPITSEQELIGKVIELIISRGLLPLPHQP